MALTATTKNPSFEIHLKLKKHNAFLKARFSAVSRHYDIIFLYPVERFSPYMYNSPKALYIFTYPNPETLLAFRAK